LSPSSIVPTSAAATSINRAFVPSGYVIRQQPLVWLVSLSR
jgi:hypothetical protein